jgi:prepilin-type N-terminal cleavage/methylation domain-containing protein
MTRRLARLRAERGFTVIEMLVAATVGSVVLIAIFSLLDFSVEQSTGTNARTDSSQRGRAAMEQVTQSLRSQVCFTPNAGTTPAVSLLYADRYKVTFYGFNGSGAFLPERRTIFWDTNSNSLKQTVEPGLGNPVTSFGTPATRTILTSVKPPPAGGGTSGDVFEYRRVLAGGATQQLTGNPLAAADLARVSVIRVRFKVDPEVKGNPSPENASSFESQIFVRTTDPNGLTGTTDPDCT